MANGLGFGIEVNRTFVPAEDRVEFEVLGNPLAGGDRRCTLLSAPYPIHRTPCTLHSAPYTTHPTPPQIGPHVEGLQVRSFRSFRF